MSNYIKSQQKILEFVMFLEGTHTRSRAEKLLNIILTSILTVGSLILLLIVGLSEDGFSAVEPVVRFLGISFFTLGPLSMVFSTYEYCNSKNIFNNGSVSVISPTRGLLWRLYYSDIERIEYIPYTEENFHLVFFGYNRRKYRMVGMNSMLKRLTSMPNQVESNEENIQ